MCALIEMSTVSPFTQLRCSLLASLLLVTPLGLSVSERLYWLSPSFLATAPYAELGQLYEPHMFRECTISGSVHLGARMFAPVACR